MQSAGPPLTTASFLQLRRALCRLFGLGRVPDAAAGEPLHHDVAVLPAQLVERRQQFFPFARPEGRWLLIDEDRPVCVARRHLS